ncbi:hypothetical protein C2E23DRAFT_745137 [Lenzites betulinus]|nr:hypothetical protein C2E23DRAFT_745137 [Lenzites betulinus]
MSPRIPPSYVPPISASSPSLRTASAAVALQRGSLAVDTLATQALQGTTIPPAPLILDDKDWPKWVREAFDYLESKEYGQMFMRVAEWWVILEHTYKWETSTKGLGTEQRPAEVAHWLRVLRRRFDRSPAIKDDVAYATQWWKWWTQLQPEWRQVDADGRAVIGGEGDWDVLKSPGKNGVLIVLLSLVWWREVATEHTVHLWTSAVADVGWVVSSMAAHSLKGERYVANPLLVNSTNSVCMQR